jgi:hypothetical protein
MTTLAYRSFTFLLQLVPLALVAAYLFVETKPPDNPSGHPGASAYMPIGAWYVFPYTVFLGLIGIVAIFSRLAAIAATVAIVGVLAYGLRLLLPGVSPWLGAWLILLSILSIAGGILRARRYRALREPVSPKHA